MFQLCQKNIFRIALTHTARKNQRSNINSIMTKPNTNARTQVPAAPALPENQVCEAVRRRCHFRSTRTPINELHLVSAAGSCPNDCSNQGRCNYETGVFLFSGYIGLECQPRTMPDMPFRFQSTAENETSSHGKISLRFVLHAG